MLIKGLDHFQLAMPPGEEETARGFYRDILGLIEIPKPQNLQARGGCWFEGPTVQLHLGVQPDFSPARKGHPAFLVFDLAALQEQLELAGVAVIPDQAVPGVRRFYAADPFGNRLEFIQDGDGFSQRTHSS